MYTVGRLRQAAIEIDGEQLHHFFRDLKSEEWLEWQRRIAGIRDGADKNAQLILLAYDHRSVKVIGYVDEGGRDLMESHPDDWRDFIPGEHKYLAWIELVSGDDLKKKSEPSS